MHSSHRFCRPSHVHDREPRVHPPFSRTRRAHVVLVHLRGRAFALSIATTTYNHYYYYYYHVVSRLRLDATLYQ